ncbi:hypothetical protein ACIBO2_12575 [Nonomuraea sp. NPDC050022]|uniref:hypothetical protein n=1 Tax=unclassified Nonomuraea TaxID=2593643 RepID=UPI0033FC7EAD
MTPFSYQALPMRVVFGVGAVKSLPQEIEHLGHRRALVLCGPEQESTGRTIADAPDTSPIISLMAEEGVRALTTALPP